MIKVMKDPLLKQELSSLQGIWKSLQEARLWTEFALPNVCWLPGREACAPEL
jgi:hypothetical protein